MRKAAMASAGIEDLAHGPTDDSPGVNIQDSDQVQPALSGQDAGGVGDPNLVWALYGEVLQSVGRDRSTVAAVGGGGTILGALSGKNPLLTHQPRNAVAPSGTAQRMSQSWTAIGLATAGKFLTDALTQTRVLESGAVRACRRRSFQS